MYIYGRIMQHYFKPFINKPVYILLIFGTFIVFYFCFNNEIEVKHEDYQVGEDRSTWASLFECPLPETDPWQPQDWHYFEGPGDAKLKECPSNGKILSKLQNGKLWINGSTSCQYRCLNYNDDKTGRPGKWISYNFPGPVKVTCDWVDVSCKGGVFSSGYRQVHSQIYINPQQHSAKKQKKQYNVYILGLDSISMSQFHRTMPRTAYFIENKLQGIEFKHLSKVGHNSVPNQMAALFGQRFLSMPHNPPGYSQLNISNKRYCVDYHTKDEQYIGFIYNDAGYRTAHIDDMLPLVQAYPNCKGFGFAHTNHSTVPWCDQMDKEATFKEAVLSCKEDSVISMEFFENFIKANTAEPKFAFTMLTSPGHSGLAVSYKYDDYLYRWLLNIENDLDDSFLLLCSDHGHHYGKYLYTDRGQIDTRNPMLNVVLPKGLRGNVTHPMVQNLMMNAQQLVSQYDIFPTLVDLVTANFDNFNSFSNPLTLQNLKNLNPRIHEVHGDSLLRPLTHRTPTCPGLGIPFIYCLCHWPTFTPPDVNELKTLLISKIPILLNGYIKQIHAVEKCMKLEIDADRFIEVVEVAVKLPSPSNRMIRSDFSFVGHNYAGRHMRVHLELTPSGSISFAGPVYRYESHLMFGECLVDEYDKNFCICKDLV